MKNIVIFLKPFLVLCAMHLACVLAAQTNSSGRQAGLDSLWNIWQDKTRHDTIRLRALDRFACDGYLYSQPDSALYFAQLEYDLAKSLGLKKYMSTALNTQGVSYYVNSNYPKALELYQQCLAIDEELGNKHGIARALLNIGNIYLDEGDYSRAMESYQKNLAIREELNDKKGISNTMISIGMIYSYQSNYPRALEYYQKSLTIKEEIKDKKGIASVLNNIASIFSDHGNYPKAIEYYQKSLAIFEELDHKQGIASAMNGIGLIYSSQGNYPEAIVYFEKSLAIDEEMDNKEGIAASLYNLGLIYFAQKNFQKTLEYYQKSLAIEEELGNQYGIANSLQSFGIFYKAQGNYPKAMEYCQKSMSIREELEDKMGIANSLNTIGWIYHEEGNHPKALEHCQKGLALAKSIDVLQEQKNACQCLYDTYKAMGKGNEALVYLEQMNTINDSLKSEETAKKLLQLEFDKILLADSIAKADEARLIEVSHQDEVRQKNRTRNLLGVGVILVLLLAVGIYSRLRYTRKAKAIIEKEKDRSENLLLNILPADIAAELKEKGRADARDFDMVSILFTDFKGFTAASEKLSAQDLVSEINACFEAFDGIIGKYNIEKIKTIGDAYMAAGGLPIPSDDSVKNTVLAALDMQKFISKRKIELDTAGKPSFEMRVGIHTGPVVAGIVGVKKFAYDIWGDTVNTASRMESSGAVGQVNISESTHALLKADPRFAFESRGKIEAKGKGEMEMFFVKVSER